jgi:hypothetical protein
MDGAAWTHGRIFTHMKPEDLFRLRYAGERRMVKKTEATRQRRHSQVLRVVGANGGRKEGKRNEAQGKFKYVC